ncbi:IS110 family transposase [Nocardia sp. CY15]|uniref:IS110 family transposase n=1 Tax=Nocardia sp. CY15 TaxID=2608687 RepID=UPI001F0BA324|nr:IS110 family transposase [Nocardia sp. CY15]
MVIGVDPHKHNHTAVAVDGNGRKLGQITVGTTAADIVRLLDWGLQWDQDRQWAVEDCRHVAGALVRALVGAGQAVVMVAPKLMSQTRSSARTRGKSDPIDALAVARAALREPDLPEAHLDDQALEVRLLLDHREDLIAERTRMINRLRWHLHDLDILLPAGQALNSLKALDMLREQLESLPNGIRVEIALELFERITTVTRRISQIKRRIEAQIETLAPQLLEIPGCAGLTAAKLLAETAGAARFRSSAAFAMHAGTAPIPVWTGNRTRFRLNRGGNRQLNAALHRIAVTQLRTHPPARALVERRTARGNSKTEALRVLKRHLADVVYHRLQQTKPHTTCHEAAA